MIIQNSQRFIGEILKFCFLLFFFCLGITSCVEDDSAFTPEPFVTGDALVKLTINTPSADVPRVTTRSQTADEAKIEEITVLVFRNNKFQYSAGGQNLNSTITSTTFEVALQASADPLTLLLIANSNDVISSSGIVSNDTKTVVKEKLICSFTDAGISFPFPMYGEHDVSSLSANGNNDISGIKMVRSIARADVLLADDVTNFELVSVQLFRANSKIQIIPDAITDAVVTAPSVPAGATANVETSSLSVTGNKSESQLYFPESEAPAESNRISDATCIVVGGKYNGSATTTYYRIDFNSGVSGHPFGQILRNYKYVFTIKGVGVVGKDEPEDAANAQSAGITVEVESWDENSVGLWYEGEGYFAVSDRTLFLRPWAATFKQADRIIVNTNIPSYSIQWSDINGVPLGGSSPSTTSISNSNYIVSINNHVIEVEALTNNEQNTDWSAYFVIRAGKWEIVMTIHQYGLSKHMEDLVRVLSFSEIGDLGDGYADETSSAAARAMRQILNIQFNPTGIFKFGGYHFTELARVSSSTTISPTVFSNFDVIYFPYNQQPSLTVCNNIMNWLNAKSNRVLIVAADNSSTNANLLVSAGDNLGWNHTTSGLTSVYDIVINEDSEIFTQAGLFGSITPGAYFEMGDATWGRATVLNSQVTPLLTASNGDMVLGVNKTKRIVYIGEVQLFYNGSNGLSGTTGAIGNDPDKFMGNLWAWITEVVLSGK